MTHFDKITPDESPSEIWISFCFCQHLRQNSLVLNQNLPFLDGHKLTSILHVENKKPHFSSEKKRGFHFQSMAASIQGAQFRTNLI